VSSEYDVIVIGAGPGGYVAAIRAAQLGKKAAVVEKDEVGGVCLNRGCIPSKSLISASHRYQEALQGAEMGIETAETRVNFAKVQSWKQGIVKKLTGGVQSLFKGYGVDLIPERRNLPVRMKSGLLKAGNQPYTASNIVFWPAVPGRLN